MLILSRQPGERIVIGRHREITITILKTSQNQVKIGVEAPKHMPILREELNHPSFKQIIDHLENKLGLNSEEILFIIGKKTKL